jgi:hypothetical protein
MGREPDTEAVGAWLGVAAGTGAAAGLLRRLLA